MQVKPYYAVIFTSTLTEVQEGYQDMAQQMETLAKKQPGFLGINSVREDLGISVSYWETEKAILDWKANLDHLQAQKLGREKWYASYKVEIAKVERAYTFKQPE